MYTIEDIKINNKMKHIPHKKTLEQQGFKARSNNVWKLHKCIYKNEDKPELFLDIVIEQDDGDNCWVATGKVVDYKGDTYTHYYNRQWGDNELVSELDNTIDVVLSELAESEIIKKKRRR